MFNILTLTIATFLAISGLFVCLLLAKWIFAPLVEIWRGRQRGNQAKVQQSKMALVDEFIAKDEYPKALALLKTLPTLKLVSTPEAIEQFKEHHQNILTRALLLAEELNARLAPLPEVERLILERVDLLQLYVKAKEAFDSLKVKRQRAGKSLPSWSKDEFEQRLSQVKKELQQNEQLLSKSLGEMFDAIKEGPSSSSSVMLH